MTFSWENWVVALQGTQESPLLDDGQRASLAWMGKRLPQSGLVLADEVGTGKTRIACAVVQAVLKVNGRAAVVVPHGLMHQWQEEAKKLGMPPAKTFTSVSDFVEKAKDLIKNEQSKLWDSIAPKPDAPEWLLISHGFRSPQVRQGKKLAEWRVALPSYVLAQLSSKAARTDRRTLVGKLLDDPHKVIKSISEEIADRFDKKGREVLRKRLEELPPYRRGGDNKSLAENLQNGGREVVEKLLGYWLGEFDLLVIDEAHKSRSEVDDPDDKTTVVSGSLLSRLVDSILRQPQTGRRLCLTATPMELEPSQWLDLLKRARSDLNAVEVKKKKTVKVTIEEFQVATRDAAIAPDESERLAELINASKAFEDMLKDFVTRRRRNEDEIIQHFSSRLGQSNGKPHPHRRSRPLPIGWADGRCPGIC
ncbi:MAG: hypothetical protein HKL99_17410 [Burkholderiales bacterium]|nr:hypothetical protein [Burkholderiales bacterium]